MRRLGACGHRVSRLKVSSTKRDTLGEQLSLSPPLPSFSVLVGSPFCHVGGMLSIL